MSAEKFYITTTLPYVNSDPHLGFALEMVQADIIARYQKLLGKDVFFNTGTDEHGLKIFRKAKEEGKDIQAYVNEYAEKFKLLMPALGISDDLHFIRTTDAHHIQAAQEFWRLCHDAGDIYKKIYKVKYCVGCELEKTESDLDENGRCLLHPNLPIEIIDEENYFFRFSRYENLLLEYYGQHPEFVIPDFRFNEIKQFVKSGLQDFSISRLKSKMSWGVPVPDDEDHVMYVWFDALINYVSALGWPESAGTEKKNNSNFADYWGTKQRPNAVQIAGKDNLRQQSAMWQAMLISAGLPNSKQIIIHGFINSGGKKMSKSLGNVADPYDILAKLESKGLTKEQACDALRYYLAREISTFEDGDYTWDHFVETYNAGLANGLGNLTSRIMKMAANAGIKPSKVHQLDYTTENSMVYLEKYEIQKSIDEIWKLIAVLDAYIQKEQPFKVIKTDVKAASMHISHLLDQLASIGILLQPFLPNTSKYISNSLKDISDKNIPHLFPRIEA
jgi:methionyl-tRNA synthetase